MVCGAAAEHAMGRGVVLASWQLGSGVRFTLCNLAFPFTLVCCGSMYSNFGDLILFGNLICCVLIGVAIPAAVLLVVRPVSGSDYLSIPSTDLSMRNSVCYLDLVYSNKHDSVVGLFQRIGL